MSGTKQKRTINVEPERIMRILHVDDKPTVLQSVRDVLESKHYSVVSAKSPTEAIQIIATEKEKFKVMIVDIRFEKPEDSISGIEFVATSEPFLKDITKIALTGYYEEIKEGDVSLFDGGIVMKSYEEELYEKIDVLYNQELEKLQTIVNDFYDDKEHYLGKEYIKQQQDKLIKELESVKGDELIVATQDKSFTAKELIDEVKNETETGKRYVRLLLNYLDSKKGDDSK